MQKIILVLLLICFSFISYSQAADEYFRTLRNDKVNLRQGPSFDYPIKIIYKINTNAHTSLNKTIVFSNKPL